MTRGSCLRTSRRSRHTCAFETACRSICKVIVEGEEIGGTHLDAFVRGQKQFLAADVVVISDGAMFAAGVPSICRGLRGLAYFQVTVRSTSTDLHSGSFGGAIANSAMVLVQILARMKDDTGRITIPGSDDDVRPLSTAERLELADLPFDDDHYREGLGASLLFGEPGYTTLERLWTRPTFDVHGLLSGFTGVGAKTVLRQLRWRKVSMRLVADQDANAIGDLFEAYVKAVAPETADVTVTRLQAGNAWTRRCTTRMRAAARALELGFGAVGPCSRLKGDSNLLCTFADVLDSPVVLFELGLPTTTRTPPMKGSASASSTTALSRRRTCTGRSQGPPRAIARSRGESSAVSDLISPPRSQWPPVTRFAGPARR